MGCARRGRILRGIEDIAAPAGSRGSGRRSRRSRRRRHGRTSRSRRHSRPCGRPWYAAAPVLKLRFKLLIAVLQFLDGAGELPDLALEPLEPHHQFVAAFLSPLPLALPLVLALGRLSRWSEALTAAKKIVQKTRLPILLSRRRAYRRSN